MIDRDTAIQLANDCGVWVDSHGNSIVASIEAMERLITRAQNEAFEQAAKLCWDTGWNAAGNDEYQNACATLTEKIRSLQQE